MARLWSACWSVSCCWAVWASWAVRVPARASSRSSRWLSRVGLLEFFDQVAVAALEVQGDDHSGQGGQGDQDGDEYGPLAEHRQFTPWGRLVRQAAGLLGYFGSGSSFWSRNWFGSVIAAHRQLSVIIGGTPVRGLLGQALFYDVGRLNPRVGMVGDIACLCGLGPGDAVDSLLVGEADGRLNSIPGYLLR